MSTLGIHTSQTTNATGQQDITIALDGNLDNSTVASFEAKLMPTLEAKPAQLIFDLAALKYVTSAGMRLFFMAMKQQKQNGAQAAFVNLQPQIKEVFAIMGSIPGVQIFRDQAEMDAYLMARQMTHTQPSAQP